jgi:hypothetical protein
MYQSGIFSGGRLPRRARPDLGTVEEPARAIPIFRDCDVLVVGGGPSGTAAAIAAARLGADVILLERHNHLGGLSTGGLVIWIDRMTDWTGQQVIRGIANDLLDRLPKDAVAGPPRGLWGNADEATAAYWKERTAAYHGIVTWSPTIDPEHLKLASQELVLEHKVHLLFHAWGAMPLMRDGAVGGVIFESKEGRKAIRAAVTIDCTGDGDIFHRAGAASTADVDTRDIHHCINTAWLFGGVDMQRWIDFKTSRPEAFSTFMERGRAACGGLFERPFVSWRNDVALFMGPRLAGYSAVDVEDLTEVDIRSHRLMAAHLAVYRLFDPVRAANRRAPRATPGGSGAGDAGRLGLGCGAAGRNRRLAVAVAEISRGVSTVRRAGARDARWLAGRRAGGVVRCDQPLLPARGAAMLADRSGRRRGRGAGGRRGGPAQTCADRPPAGGAFRPGGLGAGGRRGRGVSQIQLHTASFGA